MLRDQNIIIQKKKHGSKKAEFLYFFLVSFVCTRVVLSSLSRFVFGPDIDCLHLISGAQDDSVRCKGGGGWLLLVSGFFGRDIAAAGGRGVQFAILIHATEAYLLPFK